MLIVTIYVTEGATIYESSGKAKVAEDRWQQNRILLLETPDVMNAKVRWLRIHIFLQAPRKLKQANPIIRTQFSKKFWSNCKPPI